MMLSIGRCQILAWVVFVAPLLVGEKAFVAVSFLIAVSDGCFEILEERIVECVVLEGTLTYIELAPGRFKVLMPA